MKKPQKPVEIDNYFSEFQEIEIASNESLEELIKRVIERGGDTKQAFLDFRDDGGFLTFSGFRFSDEEFKKIKEKYDLDLKIYNEWLEKNKEAEEEKLKKRRLAYKKGLETKRKNLQKELEKIENKLKHDS